MLVRSARGALPGYLRGGILTGVMPADAPDVVRAIWQALERSDDVAGIGLGGSRAAGGATELSDWDLYLDGEPARLMAALPGLVAPLRPLAAFWEPLSEQAGYMMVMTGPVKVDLFPLGGRRSVQPPWVMRGADLGAIDGHFWDWILWLGSKALRGQAQLVSEELVKMQWFLLGPLGIDRVPADIQDAVHLYLPARTAASRRFGAAVRGNLGRQVLAALRQHQLVS